MQSFIKKNIPELLALALIAACLSFFVSQKEGYHMDELLSFELSNAAYNPWIVPTQPEGRLAKFMRCEIQGETFTQTVKNLGETVADVLKNRGGSVLAGYKADVYPEPVWISAEQFEDYITVNGKDAFSYFSVYFNVKDDNHPPLHFMLLHTVSSVLWGRAEPFMGCLINIAAALGCCMLLMALGRLGEGSGTCLWNRRTGLAAALLYGLSSGAVAATLLIRMYGVMTFFCVALFYLHLKKWRNQSFDRRNGLLIAVTVLGFLTQYFFLFYCLALALVTAALLARRRVWRQLARYIRSMACAAVIGLAVFPFAVSDVFSSGRGVEALGNLKSGLGGYGERLSAFSGILLKRLFGSAGFGMAVLGVLAAAVVLTLLLGRRAGKAGLGERSRRAAKAGSKERSGRAAKAGSKERSRRAGKAGREEGPAGCLTGAESDAVCGLALLLIPPAVYFLLAARMSPYLVDRYIMAVFPFGAAALALALCAAARAVCAGPGLAGGVAGRWGGPGLAGGVAGCWGGPGLAGGVAGSYGGPGLAGGEAGCCGGPGLAGGVAGRWGGPGPDGGDGVFRARRAWEGIAVCAAVLAVCAVNLASYDGEYLYRGYAAQEAAAEANKGLPCICVYDGVGYYENLKEFTRYGKTLLLKPEELENRVDTESVSELEQVAVLVKGNVDGGRVRQALKEKYGLKPVRALVEDSVYGDTVWLYAK